MPFFKRVPCPVCEGGTPVLCRYCQGDRFVVLDLPLMGHLPIGLTLMGAHQLVMKSLRRDLWLAWEEIERLRAEVRWVSGGGGWLHGR